MVEDLLKKNNLKVTKQRIDVIKSIMKLEENSTIHNIASSVDMDLSTIYRIINVLIINNIIEKDVNFDNKNIYKIKNKHQHYIKCVKCNKIKEMNNCSFDNINIEDFEITNHSLKLEGICKECKER